MRFLKRALRKLPLVESQLQRVRRMERRIEELEDDVFHLLPEEVTGPKDVEPRVEDLLAGAGFPASVSRDISKYDTMYEACVKLAGSRSRGTFDYFAGGLHMMQVLDAIVGRKFGEIRNVRAFLDFAGGYGRLTRFLVTAMDADHVWISDIKEDAVRFQKEKFGVQGWRSSSRPEEFVPPRKFDVVFAGSFFSHLPATSFRGWLKALGGLLDEHGLFIFTVRDIGLLRRRRRRARPETVFIERNEELLYRLHGKEGHLDPRAYGDSFVDESFVAEAIRSAFPENARYARYAKGMWAWQDIFIVSRDAGEDFSGLSLPSQASLDDFAVSDVLPDRRNEA